MNDLDVRSRIIAAGRQLFSEYGYHGLSMRRIAEVVGVSKAALYYHFQDKESLFLAVLSSYLEALEAEIERIVQEEKSTAGRLRRLVLTIFSQPYEERAGMRVASQDMAHLSPKARETFNRLYEEKFIRRVQAILEHGMAAGELRQMDPQVVTWALLGMLYPYFYPEFPLILPPGPELALQLVEIFLEGTAKGK
ncbi:MAG: TetR/AcrR family transcriptional regulator [Chloroflexi bacterium]|nr:TetR/AcrR family transcriptional regulator [Chloroflexota bacterium]